MFLLFRTRCQFSRFFSAFFFSCLFFVLSLSTELSWFEDQCKVDYLTKSNRFKFFDENMYRKDFSFDFVWDQSSIDSDFTTRSLNSLAMITNNQEKLSMYSVRSNLIDKWKREKERNKRSMLSNIFFLFIRFLFKSIEMESEQSFFLVDKITMISSIWKILIVLRSTFSSESMIRSIKIEYNCLINQILSV